MIFHRICMLAVGSLALFLSADPASGQPQLLKQIKNNVAPIPLTPAERAELGDPLFELVLENQAGTFHLETVEQLLQPQADRRQLFVVGEASVAQNPNRTHRAVIAFEGFNQGIILSPNVMLSVVFRGNVFPVEPEAQAPQDRLSFIEGWGWDANRGRYNYYRMDNAGGGLSWKFKGSSLNADTLTKDQREGTCFQCHINGAPLMKELLVPWNNWHSDAFELPQLDRLQVPSVRWNVATEARFVGVNGAGGLSAASRLELAVRSSLKSFNQTRIMHRSEPAQDGVHVKVGQAKRLLKPLFVTTEFNLISSRVLSNRHPLSSAPATAPGQPVEIPASFFLNADLIAGGGQPGFAGLGLDEALRFPGMNVAVATPDEYKGLVVDAGLKIAGQPGDANFAWFAPEPSHIDNQMCDELMKRGIVPGQFAAAVLAIDFKTPLLSAKRESLLKFVPDEFEAPKTPPTDPHDETFFKNHALTKATIAALEASSPAQNSVEMEFLKLLRMDAGAPRDQLRQRVAQYALDLKTKLQDQSTRGAELDRIFEQLIDVRKRILDDPILGELDETGGTLLFPSPSGS